jgi:glycine/D-amino acid oxidase-like deaminating enzyme
VNPSTPSAAAFRPVAVSGPAAEPGGARGDRIVVIGAGVLGISTAVQLARRGAQVTVVTEAEMLSGASGRSLSWLNSAGDRTPEYYALRMAGIDRYRTLAMTRPETADWLRFDGALMWAGPDESFVDTFRAEHAAGYDAQWVDAHEVPSVTPGVAVEAVAAEGAIFNPGEGWVDLGQLVRHLAAEARRLGVEVLEHTGPAHPRLDGGRVVGVELAGGRVLPADVVVLAAGAGTPALAAELGTPLDDASPIALLVRARAKDPDARIDLRAVLNTPRVAIRPAPGSTFVLDSAWSEEEVEVHADGTWSYRESTVAGLLAEASNVLEGHPELEMVEVAMGPKPVPGDGDPVFGWLPSAGNVYAMFTHSGATLGLIGPELAAREILTGVDSPLLAVFRPARFAVASAPALAR